MIRAETLSLIVSSALALAAIFGYLIDAAGFGVAPVAALGAAAAVTTLLAWRQRGATATPAVDVVLWAGVVVFVLAAIVRLGGPSSLLPGRGPDLTHHLVLVEYIEQHRQLVHDRTLDGSMGEMAHYTPGAHLLAVFAGWLFGSNGLRAFFPLLAACAALTAGFIFLIARRLQLAAPHALVAVMLLFLPVQYFYGAFTHDGFLAQTVATFFAVAAWWVLMAWDDERTVFRAAVFAMFLAATFVTWPVFIGPLVLVFLALAFGSTARVRDVAIGLAPLVVVAAIHVAGRWGWIGIVRTSGAVLHPSLESVGWLLPLLAVVGMRPAMVDRRARTVVVLLFAIALQAVTLFVMAKARGADTPYMAFKMMYLAIYPMAILGAGALSFTRVGSGGKDSALAWLMATALLLIAVRPALMAPREVPVVDLDLYDAGRWARANVGQTCVDYLVADAQTAYWLHLAVLGNPRSTARMQEIDVYDPRAAVGPWITGDGRAFAIADLRRLPDEVRSRVEIVRTFGHAVVLRRPGAATCYDGGL